MAKPSFNKFAEMLDKAVGRIPPHFLRDLTGGLNLKKDKNVMEIILYKGTEDIFWDVSLCFIMVPLWNCSR